jgi:hypothetical protein
MYMNDEFDSNVYVVSLSPILQIFKHVILIFQIQEPLNQVGNQVPTPCGQGWRFYKYPILQLFQTENYKNTKFSTN